MRRVVVLGLGVALAACRAPTEITLEVTTDIACADLRGTSITVAPSTAGLEDLLPATITTQCASDGTIGSMVVVPGGADDGQLEVRVIGGKDQDVETCKAPGYGPPPPSPTGCVVARRLLSFEPHDPLYLPIVLRDVCVGIPCDSGTTCVEGTCVDATVKDPQRCTSTTACGESSLAPPDGGAPDAGPPDAGPDDAGPDDAGAGDAGAGDAGPGDAGPDDGGLDAGPDAGPDDGGLDAGPDDGGPDGGGGPDPVVEVAAAFQGTSCARTMSGKIYCWGSNDDFKMGIGSAGSTDGGTPVTPAMTTVTDPTGLGLASSFFCVLTTSDGVLCAGNGQRGQLGDGVMGSSDTPVQVDFSDSAQFLAVGENHACAVVQPQIQCWGAGTSGQLGYLTSSDTATPVAFGFSSNSVLTPAAGGDTTCVVIQPGGNVRCWGSDVDDKLARDVDGGFTGQPQLVNVPAADGIAVGPTSACALVGQQAQCWGLADGASVTTGTIAAGNLANVVQVALGNEGGCARLTTGEVYCWGANDVGQLGQGSTGASNTFPPIPVPGIADATFLAVSGDHVCVARSSGKVSCWGDNGAGQVSGNGMATPFEATPVDVPIPNP